MEKRKLKRKQLIYYLSIFDRNSGYLVGQLVDITVRGVMLTSEHPIEPDTQIQLRMVLPDVIEGNNQIVFDVRSLWCQRDINPNFYDIGCEFTRISDKAKRIIESLTQEFSFIN